MSRRRLVHCAAVATFLSLISSLAAKPPATTTFRNNLIPGHLTVHRLTRTVTRTAQRKDYVEQLNFRQIADWVQCTIDESKPGNTLVYQMLVEQPTEVVSLKRGREAAKPTPPAVDFGLTLGTPALRSAYRTPQDSPVQVPLSDAAQRAVMNAVLDFSHWPAKPIAAGHRWERDLRGNGWVGQQRFTFTELTQGKGGTVATVTLELKGRFEDPLAKDYVFGRGRVVIYWARMDRTPVKVEAEVEYGRRRENAPERYELKLDMELSQMMSLSEEAQESVIDQMTLFSEAQNAQRAGREEEAREACRKILRAWPDTIWAPAVLALERRVTPEKGSSAPRLTPDKLAELLARAVVAYEAARSNYEYDKLERAGEALRELATDYHAGLIKLAQGDDAGCRGRAVFALAFGRREDDLRVVEKAARDEVAGVRALALMGLTARHDPRGNLDLLVLLLDDRDTGVRRRACQAVATCLPPEHFSAVKAVEKLVNLMIQDDNAAVRCEAIRALAIVGAPVDIIKLEQALKSELNAENRSEIERAIERLKAKDLP